MATEQGATFDEFVQGGARLDDADITVKSARWDRWDYKGKVANPVLALRLDVDTGDGADHEPEFLSSGELRFFVPSSDGKKAIPVGGQTKLNINTNAVAFIVSVINADKKGELAAKIRGTDDISILDGLKCHVIQQPAPKRAGIIQAPTVEGQAPRAQTQLICEKIIAYPWESGAATGSGTVAAAAGNGQPSEAEQATLGTLLVILGEAGGSIKKAAIAGKVFNLMKTDPAPARNAVFGLIVSDAFLGSEAVKSAGMVYDKAAGTVSMAG